MEFSKSEKRSMMLLVFMIPFLMGLGVDLYVPSLPAITDDFHTQTGLVQLTISLYMLGYGTGQVFLGVLSDNFGRRKILLISGLFYTVFSFLAIVSPDIRFLDICRLLQGLGVAGMAVVSRAIVVDCFQGKDLVKATNYFGLSWALGPILGPFFGGYLQHFWSWRVDFYLFGFYGLFILIFTFVKLPETNLNLSKLNFRQMCRNMKMITAHSVFMNMTLIAGFGYAIVVVFNGVGPFLVETVLQYSVVFYGQIALCMGISYFAGALVNRFIASRYSILSILLLGLYGALLASIAMIALGVAVSINLAIVIIPVLLIFFLCGFIVPNTLAKSMSLFPKLAGTASSIFGALSGVTVSLVTSFASNLKISSQLPMAFTYFSLLLVSLILFYVSRRIENRSIRIHFKGPLGNRQFGR